MSKIYMIVDEKSKPARHLSNGKLAVFENLTQLKRHYWRYIIPDKEYKIATLSITKIEDVKS